MKFTILHAPIFAFFSSDFYWAVANRWKGICFFYLLLLTFLAAIPLSVKFWINVSKVDRAELSPVTSQIPRIEIRNGEASVKVRQPHYVRDPKSGKTFMVIDTTGKTSPQDLGNHQQVVLLSKHKIYVIQPHKVQDASLSDLAGLIGDPAVIDQTWMEDTVLWWMNLIKILCFPFLAAITFVYRFVEVFILAIVALLIGASKKPALTFGQSLRISAMAVTPVIIINTVYEMVVPAHGFGCVWWLFCLVIPLLFLIYGVRCAYRQSPPSEEQSYETEYRQTDGEEFFGFDRYN